MRFPKKSYLFTITLSAMMSLHIPLSAATMTTVDPVPPVNGPCHLLDEDAELNRVWELCVDRFHNLTNGFKAVLDSSQQGLTEIVDNTKELERVKAFTDKCTDEQLAKNGIKREDIDNALNF